MIMFIAGFMTAVMLFLALVIYDSHREEKRLNKDIDIYRGIS